MMTAIGVPNFFHVFRGHGFFVAFHVALDKTEFFEDIKLTLTNGTLNVVVKEYPIINAIVFEGEKSNQVRKKVVEKLSLKEKQSFIENKLFVCSS